ncbi:ATP-dependent DNA helicase RecG [Corynebacterium yudongzhengii]|uniref:ATP-dependent DNA helicase RecG n=1 Tax=Corynebacterium yudongzhengii TaxID=2080740 RepID=A0A2U1T964_9CORY|nr:ATP-dependent DNA helicase RecG [Corynebacterium yudongzhengii]AWB82029.1 ATP-dependent DNA helicase RecG [Corynebacterium yudongzhengii]PWC02533.1 ATP-dependent DNA helicase RecG [Corynebacterium yudongzhengii]
MLGYSDDRALKAVLPAKEARAIKRAFGYTTCQELLEHYPRRYRRHGDLTGLDGADSGEVVTFVGTVVNVHPPIRKSAKKFINRFDIVDDSGMSVPASFFNSHYAARALKPDTVAIFSGKITYFRGLPQLQHPDFFVLDASGKGQGTGSLKALADYGALSDLLGAQDYMPVYPATKNFSTWRIMGAIWEILDTLAEIPEPLDQPPRDMPGFDAALRGIHRPPEAGPAASISRMKYNEALGLALVMALRRHDHWERRAPVLAEKPDGHRQHLMDSLPFPLTDGQQQVLAEIDRDLAEAHPMSRLLQGEVGSGKTIVALLAMLRAVDNGHQCAMLVPTEVLAVQHARSLTTTIAAAGVSATVVALTGSMTTARKRQVLLDIVSGQVDIVVGTHALIQDTVDFFDLGMVVVDEQHRFGVEQRDQLRDKGANGLTPHLLVMTATPIPRTIAMTVFGDLEVSTLKQLPGGRRPIQSAIVPEARPAWVERAWERIAEEIAAGRQAYVVCPRIEGDGGVEEVFAYLSTERFPDLSVGLLHGRLPGEEKDRVMDDFARGGVDILVSTTVIEVGVDVPNATVMYIREAENFGVSQLHQLRGRVGRGGHASLCLLHTLADEGSPALERVAAVAATSDGFELANLDLAQRQEGDVLGVSQSGTRRSVKLLNLLDDYALIERANADAAELVQRDRELAIHLVSDITQDARAFLDKS